MRKRLFIIICAIIILFISCFTSFVIGRNIDTKSSASSFSYIDSMNEDFYVAENISIKGDSIDIVVDNTQKIEYKGTIKLGVEDLEKSYQQLTETLSKYDSYIENLSESNRSITITCRVIKRDFLSLYDDLKTLDGIVTDSSISTNNYTKTYSDNTRRLEILNTEYEELRDMMKKTNDIESIIQIRDRISNIIYEIEYLTENNNSIDDKTNYSTLTITLYKVGQEIINEVSFGQQIKDAFQTSIQGLRYVFLFVITLWWVWLIIGVVILIIIFNYKRKKFQNKK